MGEHSFDPAAGHTMEYFEKEPNPNNPNIS